MRNTWIAGVVTICFICASDALAAVIGFDHAGDAAYEDGWQSGDNGGYGFAPWALSEGTFEIRSSTGNNNGGASSGDIDSPGSGAWAIINNSDPAMPLATVARAMRPLSVPLEVGQAILVDYDSGMGANEEGGVALRGADGEIRLRLSNTGGTYVLNRGASGQFIADGGFGHRGVHLEFTLTGPDTYAFSWISQADPSSIEIGALAGTVTGTLAGTPGTLIDAVVFDRSEMPIAGSFWYANNLAIVPEPGAGLLILIAGVLMRRRK